MKNLVSYFYAIPLTITMVILCSISCSNEPVERKDYQVEIIDSCEYIVTGNGYGRSMSHKGNCKFCLSRNTSKDTIDVNNVESCSIK